MRNMKETYDLKMSPITLADIIMSIEDEVAIVSNANDPVVIKFDDNSNGVYLNGIKVTYAMAKDILSQAIYQRFDILLK